MIKIENLIKKYNETLILDSINVSFNNNSLILIYGESGSGKTTLLNILSLLDNDYTGDVYIDDENVKNICDKEKFRFNNIGFIHQNNNLMMDLSILENLRFNDNISIDRINEVLNEVNLNLPVTKKVKLLSGGERKKILIARAILNSPKIILCDEPTGPLDLKNKKIIYQLLKKLSQKYLIIVVSHDKDLLNYCDEAYQLIYHQFIKIKDDKKPFKKEEKRKDNINNKLSLRFMFRYFASKIKVHKYRSILSIFSTSLGLFFLGFSLLVTNVIAEDIKTSLGDLYSENNIVSYIDENNEINEIYALDKENVEKIYLDNINLFTGIGSYYLCNYETFLQSSYLSLTNAKYLIDFYEINIRSINECSYLKDYAKEEYYPSFKEHLSENEIILKLRKKDVKRINNALGLEDEKIDTLSEYLKENRLEFTMNFINPEWDYEDQIFFYCNTFIESEEIGFISDNLFFNEIIFEDLLRYKSSNDLIASDNLPWTLKKVYYLKTAPSKQIEVAKELMENINYKDYSFDFIDGSIDTRFLNDKSGLIYVTKQSRKKITLAEINELIVKENIQNYELSCNKTYTILKNLNLSGFTNATYLLCNENEVIKIIDDNYLSEENIMFTPKIYQDINGVYGGIGRIQDIDNLKFFNQERFSEIYGRKAQKYDEVIISSAVAKTLFPNIEFNQILNRRIHFLTIKDCKYDGVIYQNEFVHSYINIVGIVEDERSFISSICDFIIFYYVNNLNYQLSSLYLDAFCFDLDNLNMNDLKEKYPSFNFVNPSKIIEDSINKTIVYLDTGLIIFGSVTLVASSLLISLIIYLFIVENKKEIAILKCIGIDNKSTRITFLLFSIFYGILAYFYSLVMLTIITIYLVCMFKLNITFDLLISYIKASGVMLIIILVLTIVIGILISSKVKKYDAIKLLKENI